MEEISVILKGPGTQDTTELSNILTVMTELKNILEKIYLARVGGQRFSQNDRREFQIRVIEFRKGSHIWGIGLLTTSASAIWDQLMTGFEALKYLLWAYYNGEHAAAKRNDVSKGMLTINVQGDGNNITISDRILNDLAPHIIKMASVLNEGDVEEIAIANTKTRKYISMNVREKNIFHPTIREEDVIFVGDIQKFNKKTHTGRLIVHPNQQVMEGEYGFKSRDELGHIIIDAMKHTHVIIKGVAHKSFAPIEGGKVQGFTIRDIRI